MSAYYSYEAKLNDKGMKLALGLSAGAIANTINFHGIVMDEEDNVILPLDTKLNDWIGDASFGAFLYNKERFYAGFSIQHLVHSSVNFLGDYPGYFVPHYYFLVGYTVKTPDDIYIEGSAMMKVIKGAPLQAEIAYMVALKNIYAVSVSYRTADAVCFGVNMLINEHLIFGYSYDIGTSTLNSYHSNSHELEISYFFGGKRKGIINY